MNIASQNRVLQGVGIAPGLALGWAYVLDTSRACEWGVHREVSDNQVSAEHARLRGSIEAVLQDLDQIAATLDPNDQLQLGALKSQRDLLRDTSVVHWMYDELNLELANAEFVVGHVLHQIERDMRNLGGDDGARQASHVSELKHRLLRALLGCRNPSTLTVPERCILVAHELRPGHLTDFGGLGIEGVALEQASACSRVAVIAQEAGVPAVSHLQDFVANIADGDLLLIDADAGTVIVNPDAGQTDAFQSRMQEAQAVQNRAWLDRNQPVLTTDGQQIHVFANVGGVEDCRDAIHSGAEGIGLFRIESICHDSRHVPTERFLAKSLAQAFEPWEDKPVTVRLLDMADWRDVPLAGLTVESDQLGCRGVRLLKRYPTMLLPQIRAILSLSKEFNVRILLPMVTFADEVREFREVLEKQAIDLGASHLPEVGALIETPAAALSIGEIAEQADFLMLGANDLAQYTLGAGRENLEVSHCLVHDHPSVLRLIQTALDEAGDSDICVTGSILAWEQSLKWVIQAGARRLSVPPVQIPRIKAMLRGFDWRPNSHYAAKTSTPSSPSTSLRPTSPASSNPQRSIVSRSPVAQQF